MGRALRQSTMKHTAVWATFFSIVVLIVALTWAGPYVRSRQGTAVSPRGNPPVATNGHLSRSDPEDSPATLHDLETLTGAVDPHELIGSRVDLHVMVAEDLNDYTSFWVGNKDNRILVVLERDSRSDAQREHGAPSPNDITRAVPGQTVHITGTIQDIPFAEAISSWELNDSQRQELQDQKVYIRAEHVTPEG
jgi:hypothetical protein